MEFLKCPRCGSESIDLIRNSILDKDAYDYILCNHPGCKRTSSDRRSDSTERKLMHIATDYLLSNPLKDRIKDSQNVPPFIKLILTVYQGKKILNDADKMILRQIFEVYCPAPIFPVNQLTKNSNV